MSGESLPVARLLSQWRTLSTQLSVASMKCWRTVSCQPDLGSLGWMSARRHFSACGGGGGETETTVKKYPIRAANKKYTHQHQTMDHIHADR